MEKFQTLVTLGGHISDNTIWITTSPSCGDQLETVQRGVGEREREGDTGRGEGGGGGERERENINKNNARQIRHLCHPVW